MRKIRARAWAAAALMLVSACASAPIRDARAPSGPPVTTVYVSPAGQDTAPGTRELPFRTLGHAIAIETATLVVIAAGDYEEDAVSITRRSVTLLGPDPGTARLSGRLTIGADEVVVKNLAVGACIAIERAQKVALDAVEVEPGSVKSSRAGAGTEGSIRIRSSGVALTGLRVRCSAESCIDIASSTVSIRKSQLSGGEENKRALVVETSSVTARGLELTGTSINQLLARKGARVHVLDSRFTGAGGVALAAIQGASLKADRVTITGVMRLGLLAETARVLLRSSTIGPTPGTAIGIAGGDVDLSDLTIEPATGGGISISAHADQAAIVRLTSGVIRHGARAGILLSQGDLTIEGTRFVGASGAAVDGEDAIVASSPDALLKVRGATIESSAGFGVSLNNNAAGTVTATITKPRLGGVMIQAAAGASITIQGSRIESCKSGSGIAVHDATEVQILSTTVSRCPEAGVLAGQGATVEVRRSRLIDNGQYGLAAFGGAVIDVSSTRAKGSRWATFATCGDGARIDDGGANRFEGQTTICP